MNREYESLYEEKWPFANISIYTIKRYLEGELKIEELSEIEERTLYFKNKNLLNLPYFARVGYLNTTYEEYLEFLLETLRKRISSEELIYFLENLKK